MEGARLSHILTQLHVLLLGCVKEISKCGLTCPLATVRFTEFHVSPMMTAVKKPDKRRVVFDASYGISLNKSTPQGVLFE